MAGFDPYHKWFAIRPDEQPPTLYRLLGVAPFEADPDVIDVAAEQRMAYLRTCATGEHVAASQRLMNEVVNARLRLLDPGKRAAYDATLRVAQAARVDDLDPYDPLDDLEDIDDEDVLDRPRRPSPGAPRRKSPSRSRPAPTLASRLRTALREPLGRLVLGAAVATPILVAVVVGSFAGRRPPVTEKTVDADPPAERRAIDGPPSGEQIVQVELPAHPRGIPTTPAADPPVVPNPSPADVPAVDPSPPAVEPPEDSLPVRTPPVVIGTPRPGQPPFATRPFVPSVSRRYRGQPVPEHTEEQREKVRPSGWTKRVECLSGSFGRDGKPVTYARDLPWNDPPPAVPRENSLRRQQVVAVLLAEDDAAMILSTPDGRFHWRQARGRTGNLVAPPPKPPYAVVELDLDDAVLKTPDGVLGHVPYLRVLRYRRMSGDTASKARAIAAMPALLTLSMNVDGSDCDKAIEALAANRTLTSLSLHGTDAGPAALKRLSGIASLRKLQLRDVPRLDDDVLAVLATLPELTDLRINGTSVTDKGLAALGSARKLQTLHLTESRFLAGAALREIARLPDLRDLRLSMASLTDEAVAPLVDCPRLERLHLTDARLTSAVWAPLSRIATLCAIELNGTDATDQGADALLDLPALLRLRITSSLVSPDWARRFHEARRHCDVEVQMR